MIQVFFPNFAPIRIFDPIHDLMNKGLQALVNFLIGRMQHILHESISSTVEQAKFASAIISQIREQVSNLRTYRTQSIGCIVTLSTTVSVFLSLLKKQVSIYIK